MVIDKYVDIDSYRYNTNNIPVNSSKHYKLQHYYPKTININININLPFSISLLHQNI